MINRIVNYISFLAIFQFYFNTDTERERERERGRERGRDRQTARQTDRQTEKEPCALKRLKYAPFKGVPYQVDLIQK